MLERALGQGGMAEVFLASTIGVAGFSRRVAIKRVLESYSGNPQFVEMFTSEARLCSRLQHANIVSVTDFDRDEQGRLYLVMELVDGVDLAALLDLGVLPVPVTLFVVTEILRGLAYAHDLPVDRDIRGIVHRDMSPHNVLLSWSGAVKVNDFGIAKARAATVASASIQIKGKPSYMSPEQANGEPLDGRSDLFAVGVMLWEMLCARLLFAGAGTQDTLARVLFGQIPTPRALRPDLPLDVERIVLRLLERDRAARYPDAVAAIADLLACRDYPRDGSEALAAVLAERFPGRAPRRASSIAPRGPTDPTIAARDRPASAAPLPMRMVAPSARATPRARWPILVVVVVAAATGAGVFAASRAGNRAQPVAAATQDAAAALDANALELSLVHESSAASSAITPPPSPPIASPRASPAGSDAQRGIREVQLQP